MVFVDLEDVHSTDKNGIWVALYFIGDQFSKSLLPAGLTILLNSRWSGTCTSGPFLSLNKNPR